MKKVLSVLLVLFLFLSFVPATAVQAGVPGPGNPWLSEFIDADDIDVNEGLSVTRLPRLNRLAVAYTGRSDTLNYRILKFAMQVPKGTGNCGHYNEWNCMEVDTTKNVGLYNSIAAVEITSPYLGLRGVRIGISYWDQDYGKLLYASAFYRYLGGHLGAWTVVTVQSGSGGGIAGQYSKLVFDPNTKQPVIAYRTGDAFEASGAKWYLRTATYVGSGQGGNCGPEQTWTCDIIDTAPIASTDSFTNIGMGWIDGELHYFYNAETFGLKYAVYDPSGSPWTKCSIYDYYCVRIDDYDPNIRELSVASWSGNLPGTPGYNSQERENGVYLIYRDVTNDTIRYAYMPKTGTGNCYNDKFNCGVFIGLFDPRQYKGISVAMDPNYYPAFTFLTAGGNLELARPSPAYGETYSNCGTYYPLYRWKCIRVFQSDDDKTIDHSAFAAINISSGNLASIVFNPYYPMSGSYGLEILRQDDYKTSLPLIRK